MVSPLKVEYNGPLTSMLQRAYSTHEVSRCDKLDDCPSQYSVPIKSLTKEGLNVD